VATFVAMYTTHRLAARAAAAIRHQTPPTE
jgi:hypothetical protein